MLRRVMVAFVMAFICCYVLFAIFRSWSPKNSVTPAAVCPSHWVGSMMLASITPSPHHYSPLQLRLSRQLRMSLVMCISMALLLCTSSTTIIGVEAIAPSQYMSAVPEALITWRPLDERFFFPNECFDATNRSVCIILHPPLLTIRRRTVALIM